jgi:hypothetical protein
MQFARSLEQAVRRQDAAYWRLRAQECRLKAVVIEDPKTKAKLMAFAEGYDRVADRMEQLPDAKNSK